MRRRKAPCTALPCGASLLDSLSLKNAVITVDAMNTQKKIAAKIIEKKGDYVMPLKKNHRDFLSEVEAYFHKIARDCSEMFEAFEEIDAERSRIDERYCRKRSENGKEEQEKAFYISSLDEYVATLAKCIRGHWGAENLAVLRRLSLNLARLHPKKQSMRGKLTAAGWSDSFRDELLLGV